MKYPVHVVPPLSVERLYCVYRGRGVGVGGGAFTSKGDYLTSCLNILYMEMRGIYISLNRLYMIILIFNN